MDTSHVPAFIDLFNDPNAFGDLAGFRVVAGLPDGSDTPMSRDRIAAFTEEARGKGIEIVHSPEELQERCDRIMILSVDGRIHLRQVKAFATPGKPLFVDKPLGGSLADAAAICEIVAARGTPCFSASSTRFGPQIVDSAWRESLGEIHGATSWGPLAYQEGMPDLFFYGIHGIEALFTAMGSDCETVTRVKTPLHDLITGVWSGGRVGVYRGILNGCKSYGLMIHGENTNHLITEEPSYEALCRQIGRFFKTGIAPVQLEDTLAIYTFMTAAQESLQNDGLPVTFSGVLTKTRKKITQFR